MSFCLGENSALAEANMLVRLEPAHMVHQNFERTHKTFLLNQDSVRYACAFARMGTAHGQMDL